METKNIIKLLGVLIISMTLTMPAITAASADVEVSISGGLSGISFTATNNEAYPVEATTRIVGKTLLNASRYYDQYNTTEIDAESSETFAGDIPNDFAVLYVEITCEGQKTYKYGIAFNGMAFLLWDDN